MAAIKDVAKLAGVSPSAVSKYFISPEHMRASTKERIAAAVKTLNYHPNQLARSLRNGRSNVIAITVPDVRNPYFGHYIQLMQDLCAQHDLIPLLLQVNTRREVENALQILRSGLPDGAVCSDDGQFVSKVLAAGISLPLVQISPNPDVKAHAAVCIDLAPGMYQLCQHLEAQGVRRFSFIGSEDDFSSQKKLATIQEYSREHDIILEDTSVFNGTDRHQSTYQSGYQQCQRLLQSMPQLPEVIVCASDHTALGVLKCLLHNHLDVPEDLLLASHDDTEVTFMSNPSITSVQIPLEPICAAAVENLCRILNGEEPVLQSFPTTLSIRTSTMVHRG